MEHVDKVVGFLQNPKQAVDFQAEGQLFIHWDIV
jgi:hypothetical protein